MGRCIVTGVGSAVLTYLIWRSVQVFVPELAVSFHFTCALVMFVSVFATISALYRLAKPLPVAKKKTTATTPRRPIRSQVSPLVMPGAFGKTDAAWFHRN